MGNTFVGVRNYLKEIKLNQKISTDPSVLKRKVGDRYFTIFVVTAIFPLVLRSSITKEEHEIKTAFLDYRNEVNKQIGIQ